MKNKKGVASIRIEYDQGDIKVLQHYRVAYEHNI